MSGRGYVPTEVYLQTARADRIQPVGHNLLTCGSDCNLPQARIPSKISCRWSCTSSQCTGRLEFLRKNERVTPEKKISEITNVFSVKKKANRRTLQWRKREKTLQNGAGEEAVGVSQREGSHRREAPSRCATKHKAGLGSRQLAHKPTGIKQIWVLSLMGMCVLKSSKA